MTKKMNYEWPIKRPNEKCLFEDKTRKQGAQTRDTANRTTEAC